MQYDFIQKRSKQSYIIYVYKGKGQKSISYLIIQESIISILSTF